MKKTTVVFDLDGTLLDTLQDLANAVNYALEQQGMPKRTLEEVRQFVGNGVRLLMIRAVPDGVAVTLKNTNATTRSPTSEVTGIF